MTAPVSQRPEGPAPGSAAMTEVWTMGELLVEIMRPGVGIGLGEAGVFRGPFPSGAPGIFIDTVARLGHAAGIVSGVGDDAFGRCILERLAADGVRTDLVEVVRGRATGVAFVAYQPDGSREFIYHFDGTPAVMATAPDPALLGTPRWFHVMGCSLLASEGFRAEILTTAERFAAAGARLSFDPNLRPELLAGRSIEAVAGPVLRRAAVLLPGEEELRLLGGETTEDGCLEALFARYPVEIVVLKRGARGCTVVTRDARVDVAAFAVRAIDPTGAGDCFDAGFLCGLLEGRDLQSAARLAAAAGALNARAFGPMEGRISRRSVAALLRRGPASKERVRP